MALSHDDLVDLVEAAYRHGFGDPLTDLEAVRLSESDPCGMRMVHRTPLMQRASERAYRVTRLMAAMGAQSREGPSTQDDVERAYVRAVLAAAAFDGLLWSGGRPPISRLVERLRRCHPLSRSRGQRTACGRGGAHRSRARPRPAAR